MAGDLSIEIEGLTELQEKLSWLASEINAQETLENALMDGAEIVQSAFSAAAPRRTGVLAGDIQISKKGRQKYSLRIGPGIRGFYGRYLEYGTSKMAARPWMRPTFASVHPQAQAAISQAIWAAIEKANSRRA